MKHWPAHTHLQQPDVAGSQPGKSEKHFLEFSKDLPVKSGAKGKVELGALSFSQAPSPGLPGGGTHWWRVGPGVRLDTTACAQLSDAGTAWSALITSASSLYIRQSAGGVSKGITGAGTEEQRSPSEHKQGWTELGAESQLNIIACWFWFKANFNYMLLFYQITLWKCLKSYICTINT